MSEPTTAELVERARSCLFGWKGHGGPELRIPDAHGALDALAARIEELEAVANGVIWLDNNIHNYGSDAWRGYFKAVLRDARRALGGEKDGV